MHNLLIHYVGFHKLNRAERLFIVNIVHDPGAYIFLAAEDNDFSAVEGQIAGYGAAKDTGATGNDGDIACNIKEIFHFCSELMVAMMPPTMPKASMRP